MNSFLTDVFHKDLDTVATHNSTQFDCAYAPLSITRMLSHGEVFALQKLWIF